MSDMLEKWPSFDEMLMILTIEAIALGKVNAKSGLFCAYRASLEVIR
ncbi:MAG: hypothetical protein ACI9E1_001762 [Cryomorphaceae bacterium]